MLDFFERFSRAGHASTIFATGPERATARSNCHLRPAHTDNYEQATMADDATYDDATYDEQTQVDYIRGKGHGILSKMFSSCAEDPQGSVHRAWGITLLFIVIFFIMAFVEGESLQASYYTSVVASWW